MNTQCLKHDKPYKEHTYAEQMEDWHYELELASIVRLVA